jgi:hypothetical protein
VSVRKVKNGEIMVTVNDVTRFVQVGPLVPEKKVEAVKDEILALGAVWSEEIENLTLQELFVRG